MVVFEPLGCDSGGEIMLNQKDRITEDQLAERTLTNLYNQRPTWLELIHRKLDEVVLDAYGWPY